MSANERRYTASSPAIFRPAQESGKSMTENTSVQAGNYVSGKDDDRDVEELSIDARRARLKQSISMEKPKLIDMDPDSKEEKIAKETAKEEVISDTLLRFGIQI
jgi:hypothetical protein